MSYLETLHKVTFAMRGTKMQMRRSILLAVLIILFIYFEIHSCAKDRLTDPEKPPDAPSLLCDAKGIYFTDEDNGWVIGTLGTAIGTSDGGRTWVGVSIDQITMNGVHFQDAENGWVVGKEGNVYRTADGGVTWSQELFTGYPQDDDLYQVTFQSGNLGFILGYHGVFRTEDGVSWVNNWLPVVPYRGAWGMSIVDDQVGYLLGSRWSDVDPCLIYKTVNGGLSWTAVAGSKASVMGSVLSVTFVDENTGWAGGGVIMKTTDGGEHWTRQADEATVRSFWFLDVSYGFAVGGSTILKTENGGENWIDVTPGNNSIVDLRGVQFLDMNRGWVVGRAENERVGTRTYKHSVLLSTANGGSNWTVKDFPFDYTEYLSSETDSIQTFE